MWVNRDRVERAAIPAMSAPKAEESSLPVICLCGYGDAHDVISSQQPVERWHGAASANLGRVIVARGVDSKQALEEAKAYARAFVRFGIA
jgi:hypothetical protein